MDRRQVWFDRGCEAFKRTMSPRLVEQIPWERFYVCPLCFRAFNEVALTETVDPSERLTAEHVPPESVGGRKMLLTCQPCNNEAGTEVDSHMRREADVQDFFIRSNLREIKAHLATDSGRVPIRLSRSASGVNMAAVVKAASRATHKAVMGDFEKAAVGDGWKNLRGTIQFPSYSPARASTSWLRSAYLAFFAALGYRFVWRPELDAVRGRIQNPELASPTTFRVTRREHAEPMLVYVEAPEVSKSYMMLYGHNAVFLPHYNDRTLYERLAQLAQHPEVQLTFEGKTYPWPTDGPTFLHDLFADLKTVLPSTPSPSAAEQ